MLNLYRHSLECIKTGLLTIIILSYNCIHKYQTLFSVYLCIRYSWVMDIVFNKSSRDETHKIG